MKISLVSLIYVLSTWHVIVAVNADKPAVVRRRLRALQSDFGETTEAPAAAAGNDFNEEPAEDVFESEPEGAPTEPPEREPAGEDEGDGEEVENLGGEGEESQFLGDEGDGEDVPAVSPVDGEDGEGGEGSALDTEEGGESGAGGDDVPAETPTEADENVEPPTVGDAGDNETPTEAAGGGDEEFPAEGDGGDFGGDETPSEVGEEGGGDFGGDDAPSEAGEEGGDDAPTAAGGDGFAPVATPTEERFPTDPPVEAPTEERFPTAPTGERPTFDDFPTPSAPTPTFDDFPTPTAPAPTFPRPTESFPTPTNPPPTPTPYVPKDDENDPIFGPTSEGESGGSGFDNNNDDWGWNNSSVEDLEHDQTVIIALSVTFGVMFLFSVFVAYQMLENPHGCCASICRITVACFCGLLRFFCYPCRAICGCTGQQNSRDHMIVPGDHGNYTHDLELS